MFVYTLPGFRDASVTKIFIYALILIPILVSLLDIRYLFDLQVVPHLLLWHQWWRLPLNQLLYTTQSDIITAALYFYNLRVIERHFGSHRYLSYIVLIYTLSLLFVPFTNLLLSHIPILSSKFQQLASTYIPPGPTSIVFATLVLYKETIPSVFKFQITPISSPFTLIMSDKIFVYIVAADLLFLGLPGSLNPALLGWVLGNLIYFELIPGKNWRIPAALFWGKKKSQTPLLHGQQQQASYSSTTNTSQDVTGTDPLLASR